MVSTSQVPISVCLGKMPHFIFHDSLLLFSPQFTVRSVSSRTLSLTAWVMSRKAMITGWSYLMMDSADRGFGKMAPLLHLPCKCLREIVQEKEETWGNSKFYFIPQIFSKRHSQHDNYTGFWLLSNLRLPSLSTPWPCCHKTLAHSHQNLRIIILMNSIIITDVSCVLFNG